MSAPHGQGPPRSTVADVIAAIVYHYAATATRGAWATGTTYAVNDTVSSDGRPYRCFVAGTSDTGAGPAGMGSQRDANGVQWTPTIYVGERYLKQHGAPPRIVIVPSSGTIEGPGRIGDGNVARDLEEVRAYLWAAEAADDIARYAAIQDAKDAWTNIVRKVLSARGKFETHTVTPTITANVVTFGEDRQLVATYSRGVPKNAAIWAVAETPISPPDAMRPNGSTGYDVPSLDLTITREP